MIQMSQFGGSQRFLNVDWRSILSLTERIMKSSTPLICLTWLIMADSAFAYSDNLIVFDDAGENGFTTCITQPPVVLETTVVHGGSIALRVPNQTGTGNNLYFCGAVYSAISDYDGISFWINGGAHGAEAISLVVTNDTDVGNDPLFAEVASLYGGPLPPNQWVHIQGVFTAPPFTREFDNPLAPYTFNRLTFEVETSGSDFFYIDDVVLTGADIFANGFQCSDPSVTSC